MIAMLNEKKWYDRAHGLLLIVNGWRCSYVEGEVIVVCFSSHLKYLFKGHFFPKLKCWSRKSCQDTIGLMAHCLL